uniref:Centrosomal protein 192 n=1 Tax=Esox lucius TaxID=8010 RepID=A0A3P8XCP8_ESOLU
MTESFCNIEDEAFPSFLSDSLCSGRGTLGNVTLASTLGIPVAASTVAKIRVGTDNRWVNVDDLQNGELDQYFNKLVPPPMQRGRVEGQEIPGAVRRPILFSTPAFHPFISFSHLIFIVVMAININKVNHFQDQPANQDYSSEPSSTEPERNRYQFLDDFDPVFMFLHFVPLSVQMDCHSYISACVSAGSAHSVVYQNEEGKWVTDLAYYSSFEKEVDGVKLPDEIADQFQAEEFVPIIEDQEVFEKEHQFMQEEVMEPASGSPGLLADTSWRLPASSHVLMRASQVSQEFDQGNQSYLRLSLGTFFQQRSEALGSLGANREDDMVKRPSFGYVITSPEKRDPFPLIRPSDFPSQESSVHNDTLTHTDDPPVDTPLPEVASPSVTQPSATPGSLDTSPTYSTDQPDLMLSISTIASAIADASISSDPSQLAAMIMELSKRSRLKNRRQTGVPGQSTAGGQEEPAHSPTQVLTFKHGKLTKGSKHTNCYGIPCVHFLFCFLLSPADAFPGTPVQHTGQDQTQMTFRPSTSPLTHSSPSQTSFPSQDGYIGAFAQSFDMVATLAHRSCSIGRSPRCEMSPFCDVCLSLSVSPGLRRLPPPGWRRLPPPVGVVVPDEIRFPHACCVGIASQTSLGIFNPSERWQQVSISVSSLAIDGERVESFPYQWLIVKNKTIIGPKSTEEQKVLFIPPQAGVYQAVLSVSSWPASAEAEVVARAELFAKRVVLVAVAESPALEVRTCGSLDFGDLVGGSAKALPLKVLNRTHATLPIRLVISANAMAWRCFTFSKSPVAQTAEGLLHAGTVTSLAAPSVMNHVMHASYGENPDSFMVWVHFHAPQKYQSSSGNLGPAEEYSARVDIEVDCPGPSHVISSVPLRARSGTARVHAPKDLQTVSLSAPLGKSNTLTLPLKNAGNIAVQLKLKVGLFCPFSYPPPPPPLVPVSLGCHSAVLSSHLVVKCGIDNFLSRDHVLTILVQPSGPQYEVVLRGEVLTEDGGKPDPPGPASVLGMLPHSEVPPILSNKQFMAWGGVTLGGAVQQKLVLRNNSPNTTHQLRLLIRGQDQNCFQLQSCFGSEQRLARHRELSIRPKEDVTVHLLFAPTRVACTLAKLEIKQSGVRPSQPGIKFTIPLSGYGGTSNVVLEDQRKRSDGYVATLAGISAGRVSKLCVCVRNTGSRAAFIKAVAYSDLMTRAVMDSSVISLSPSQFVLKERTQETLCRSADAILATVCLFCGDEVSRQQFRKWLQSKPEAGRKVLSENSLLKGLDFNETFLGEELVLEAYDLPQSPNQALLFYGSLSKVVLSVLGSTEASDSGERDPLAVTRRGSEADSNVSLDVLPVKGPQGPVLPRTSGPQVGTGTRDNSDTWTLQPEHVVLMAPSISGASNTRHVQIQNTTSRELSFELSWPAHCLTVTPQHGLIEPECHLQILISPNPSLAARPSMLPWSGQIYVQCDGQQKFIKVQIRQDLTLDVSAAPADRSLAPLPAQAATPVMPPAARASQHQARPGPAQVEISNRTVVFPATPSGDSSESFLEVENGPEEVRWYLSSFAPPYVKGVDSSGHVYRATYTAFRCSRVSGTLGSNMGLVPVTFLPRDRGDYAQFWDLECHPVVEPQNKNRIRFQLCGVGVKAGPVEAHQEGDCSLVKTEAIVRTRKGPEMTAAASRGETWLAVRRGVYTPQDAYTFPPTRVRETSTLKVNVRNNSFETHELMFLTPREPFHIKHSKYSLRSQRYIHLPVQFKPAIPGSHSSLLLVQTGTSGSLTIQLTGEALP